MWTSALFCACESVCSHLCVIMGCVHQHTEHEPSVSGRRHTSCLSQGQIKCVQRRIDSFEKQNPTKDSFPICQGVRKREVYRKKGEGENGREKLCRCLQERNVLICWDEKPYFHRLQDGMVGFRAKAIRRGPLVILSSIHIRGDGGTGQGSGRWGLSQLSAPTIRNRLPLWPSHGWIHRLRYTENEHRSRGRGEIEAGAEQRRVLMRERHK